MRRSLAAAGAVVLTATGFAAASIATGGSLAGVASALTGTTGTVTTQTTTTGDRHVSVCHLTGSKKHPFRTISVDQHALKGHLRHGDHVGACTGTEMRRHHGHGHENAGPNGHGHDDAAPRASSAGDDDDGGSGGHGQSGDGHGSSHH